MKIVGSKNRHDIELDPAKAWKRGMELDALLKSTSTPHPRGVWRLTHTKMNQMDLERQVAQFSRINNG
jgi:hypothetical protein